MGCCHFGTHVHNHITCAVWQPRTLVSVFLDQAPVVQTVDNAIYRINHYPLDIAIGFAITYPADSDLSGG